MLLASDEEIVPNKTTVYPSPILSIVPQCAFFVNGDSCTTVNYDSVPIMASFALNNIEIVYFCFF